MKPTRPALALLLLAGLFGLPRTAQAIRVYIPRPALCAQADVVIIGEVTGTTSRWKSGDQGGIETLTDVARTQTLRGAEPGDSLTLLSAGGTIGHLSLRIEDAAALQPDSRYLLLLRTSADGYHVVGGPDGAILLRWGDRGVGETEASAIASLGGCDVE